MGRQATLNFDMTVSALQETVTVTGEAPLLDTTSSNIAGNIDPRQMQELPLNGRNWMDLTLLVRPDRDRSTSSEIPQDRQGYFQINVDGQQVTLTVCCAQNQPRYSRDSIAEFELSTNRFDATQGRTHGHAGQRHHQVRHQHPAGTFSAPLPRRQLEREGLHPGSRHSVLRISRSAARSAGPIVPGPHPLLRQLGVRARTARRSRSAARQPLPDRVHNIDLSLAPEDREQGRREGRLPVQSENASRCAGATTRTCCRSLGRRRHQPIRRPRGEQPELPTSILGDYTQVLSSTR